MDLYRPLAPNASEHRLLRVGQIVTALMIPLSLAWIPFMRVISSGLYTYIQSVQSYISPPIAAVFLVGVLWTKANAKGAMVTLSVGFVIGAGRLLLEMNKPLLSGVWLSFVQINYLHFALLLFALSVAILVITGLLFTSPPREQIAHLVLWKISIPRAEPTDSDEMGKTRINVLLSAVVVAIVVAVWIYFS
jgi:SSS family solute:Na+ symporter